MERIQTARFQEIGALENHVSKRSFEGNDFNLFPLRVECFEKH